MRYVALLRGVNVGGRNKVAMAEVRAAFDDEGFEKVSTYIQSGNVLFDAARAPRESDVERLLEARFGFPIVVVLRSRRQLRGVVENAPEGFGTRAKTHHSDVIFVKAPLTSRTAAGLVEPREGVDRIWPGTGVVYFERLSARLVQSRMSRIASTPEYRLMTIRSWTTTTKLLDLLGS